MDEEPSFSRENTQHYTDEEEDVRGEYDNYDDYEYKDPYASRRGRYNDDNDDIGIYYDDEDLKLANEEGTYLVAVRVALDQFGNRIDYGPDGKPKKRAVGALSMKSYHRRAEREKVEPPALVDDDNDFWNAPAPEAIDSNFSLNGVKGREDEGDRARRLRLALNSVARVSPLSDSANSPLRQTPSLDVKPVGGMRLLKKQPPPIKQPPPSTKPSDKNKSASTKPTAPQSPSFNASSSSRGGKFAAALSRSARRSSSKDPSPMTSPDRSVVDRRSPEQPPPTSPHQEGEVKVVSTALEWRGGKHGGGSSKVVVPANTTLQNNGRTVGTNQAHNVLRGQRLDLAQPQDVAPHIHQSGPQNLGGRPDPLGWDESVPQHLRDARRRQLVAQAATRRQQEGGEHGTVVDIDVNQNDGDAKLLDSEDARKRRQGPATERTCDTVWFTFSGEPCDILSYRSLIAINDEMDPPPDCKQGPFPAELLAMILLFIPAHSRQEMIGISSVCRFWRYHSNYTPQWTRFRLNTWVGSYPKPVAAKLKQRKIVTRTELIEERRRAIDESQQENKVARAGHWFKESIVLSLVICLLLLNWGIAVALGHATAGLNTDGKLGSTLFFVFVVIALLDYIALRLVSYIWFDNTDRIAGAGVYAQAMRVAADGTALELAGAGGASGFVDGSKTIQTTPWILVAFTVASTVVIGLLWGRILSCRVIADAGTFAAPDILSATSNFDGTPSTTQSSGTPGFIRLPAPLSDPRWMILNTTLVYNSSLSASPSWGYYRNNTDFLDIQRSTLLWFDESRVSPLFTNAASTAIPSWWNATYGSCSLTSDNNAITGKSNNVSQLCEDNHNVSTTTRMSAAVALLLRVLDVNLPIGVNPYVPSTTGSCAQVTNPLNGVGSGGIVVAVVGGDVTFLHNKLGTSIPRNPYSYITTIQSSQSSLPAPYTSPSTTYRGILTSNYFNSDIYGMEASWYSNGDSQVEGVYAVDVAVGRLLSPWHAQRCINGTPTAMRIPLLRWDRPGLAGDFTDKATRLFDAHLIIVFTAVALILVVFLVAMCIPDDFVHGLGGLVFVGCAVVLSPITLFIFGVMCIVSGNDINDGGSGITIQGDEVAMCDAKAGAGMVATASVVGVVALLVFIHKRCAERF